MTFPANSRSENLPGKGIERVEDLTVARLDREVHFAHQSRARFFHNRRQIEDAVLFQRIVKGPGEPGDKFEIDFDHRPNVGALHLDGYPRPSGAQTSPVDLGNGPGGDRLFVELVKMVRNLPSQFLLEQRLDELKGIVLEKLSEAFEGREKEFGAAFRAVTKLAVREMPRSGKSDECLSEAGIDAEHIAAAARKLVALPAHQA